MGADYYAFMRGTWPNSVDPQCADIKLMTPDDDFVAGVIKVGDARGTDCVTYDPASTLPTSALYTSPCTPNNPNQLFMYNMVTKHLRATTSDGPALFFWWRGPIKRYTDFEESEPGYGWQLPLVQPGSVTAVDDRGYSGYCWRIASNDKRISASQTCHTFVFTPKGKSIFLSYLSQSDRPAMSVIVRSGNRCLVAKRKNLTTPTTRFTMTLKKLKAKAKSLGLNMTEVFKGAVLNRNWWLSMGKCVDDRYHIEQRHVLTQDNGANCTQQRCQGLLRWSGDYDNVLWAQTHNLFFRAAAVAEDKVSYTFDFPFDKEDYITRKIGGVTYCMGYSARYKLIGMFKNKADCLKFTVKYAPAEEPDHDDSAVVTLARFDYSGMAIYSKGSSKLSDDGRKELARKSDEDTKIRNLFYRKYDPFFADLGATGRRHFRRGGPGMKVRPSGELDSSPTSGIVFPLLPAPRLHKYKFIEMSVYFEINAKLDLDRTYTLLSFARTSGCVIYLTGDGLFGLKCYKNGKEMFTQQITSWPRDKFTLTQGTHKVSLLFSKDPSVPFRVYVDGMRVITVPNPGGWDLAQVSNTVRLFNDQYFWQFTGLSARLKRFSIAVSDDFDKLEQVAKRLKLARVEIPRLDTDHRDLNMESPMDTRWENCRVTAINPTTHFVEAVTCDIIPLRNNTQTYVPARMLRLACSRPRCEIFFNNRPLLLANKFSVTYKPNYPANFNSENVGSPPLFPDPTLVTDGWATRQMVFDIRYAPNLILLETESTTSTTETDSLDSESDATVADVRKYLCMEVKANPARVLQEVSQDDLF
eukprot:TRINITY_DN4431_c0_g1_i8.p1 TRINITY_DN4431_c0_g1~~TRINITY_DN4431_c0_g1_i8.p1  ORF type:complete len:842 (+),score=198.81 TRINITY_DN4431_c0_g1_i8:103-2526(+)